ncbi:MAG TPA: alpha/beta fold hydrolase [Gaiellaceae bacterium]
MGRWLRSVAVLVAALGLAACGGSQQAPTRSAGPRLAKICGPLPHGLRTQTSWLRTSDRVRLFAFTAGAGSTGVVLAHESPGGLCGWVPAVPTFAAHGLRVLGFDFRGFPPSASAPSRRADDFAPDLQAAVDALHASGVHKVFVVGASFGGATALAEGAELHGVAGFVSLSGELELPVHAIDALAGVHRLRAPLLVLASRQDAYLDAAQAKHLFRAAESTDKQLTLYPGSYHGWDLLEQAPFRRRVWSRLLGWIAAH